MAGRVGQVVREGPEATREEMRTMRVRLQAALGGHSDQNRISAQSQQPNLAPVGVSPRYSRRNLEPSPFASRLGSGLVTRRRGRPLETTLLMLLVR